MNVDSLGKPYRKKMWNFPKLHGFSVVTPRGFWVAKKPHCFFCPKLVEEMEQNLLTLVFCCIFRMKKLPSYTVIMVFSSWFFGVVVKNWVVVSKIFYVHPCLGKIIPIWRLRIFCKWVGKNHQPERIWWKIFQAESKEKTWSWNPTWRMIIPGRTCK